MKHWKDIHCTDKHTEYAKCFHGENWEVNRIWPTTLQFVLCMS